MSAAPGPSERPNEPAIVRRLRARQRQHRRRGRAYRAAWVVAGSVLLAAGVAMLALPGPAFVVIPIALAILSLEFKWAERLLEKALIKAAEARRAAAEAPRSQKIVTTAVAVIAVAAALVCAVMWDIPYLPV
jgi:uncharacterized protein (TIGR02611 family)